MPNEVNITITADDLSGPAFAAALGYMAAMRAEAKALKADLADIKFPVISTAAAEASITSLRGKVSDLATSFKAVAGDIKNVDSVTRNSSNSFIGYGYRFGFLRQSVDLFGGSLKSIGVPAILASATGLHLMVDAGIEVAAVVLPALIGVAAFSAAAAPSVMGIVKQFQNLNIVSQATGKSVGPLKGTFQDVADAVRPEVYQLLGDALTIINQKGGTFQTVAQGAGHVIDDLAAQFTVAVTKGQGMNLFLKNASSDLFGLGQAGGTVGDILGNLFKAMPGYAEILLGVANAGLRVIDWAVKVGEPIVHAGLAFHGAALYIGLAATAVSGLVRGGLNGIANLALNSAIGLGKLGLGGSRAAAGLEATAFRASAAANLPWGWIALVAAGVGFLAYKMITAKDATQQWFSSLETALNETSAIKGYTLLQEDMATVATKLAGAQNQLSYATHNVVTQTQIATKGFGETITNVTNAQQKVRDLTDAQKTLYDQSALFDYRLARLAVTFHGVGAAMGIVAAANISMNDMLDKSKWPIIVQEVEATTAAYRAMGQEGGVLGADMNALNIAASDQVTNMGKLNKAWDSTIGIVTGGQSTFITFEQDLQQVDAQAKKSGGSMDGLGAQSLKLRQAWQQSLNDGSKLIDALRLMQSVSPGGFPAVSKAVKLTIDQLVPFGKQSAASRAELVSLAQEVNPTIKNFAELTTWLGHTHDAGKQLNDLVSKMGVNIQDLARDAAKMSNTLQTDVINQFDIAKISASGAGSEIHKLAQDITDTGTSAHRIHADEVTLYNDLRRDGLTAKDAQTLIEGMTGALFKIPTHRTVSIDVNAAGVWHIAPGAGLPGGTAGGPFAAGGMVVGGHRGKDSVVGLLMPGEVVVPEPMVAAGEVDHLRGRLPRFASGGFVGHYSGGPRGVGPWAIRDYRITETDLARGVAAEIKKNWPQFAAGGGKGHAVAQYALSFNGGTAFPYVLGGATPQGWDCSGFTAWVYKKFGLMPGAQGTRFGTSESQWAWSKHVPSPIPGALAFFNDGIFANPGHVGIVISPTTYMSAHDPQLGTSLSGISGAVGFGIPPGTTAAAFESNTPQGGGRPLPGGGTPAANKLLGRQEASQYGWGTGPSWADLDKLWTKESGWSNVAQNPFSTAYGIAQFLDSTWATVGGHKTSNPGLQILYGLRYIQRRYGDPEAAWAHEVAFNSYDRGGVLHEDITGVGMRSGQGYKLHAGETVHPKNNPPKLIIEIRGGGSSFDKFMMEWIRDNVRGEGGGDVQVAFGSH